MPRWVGGESVKSAAFSPVCRRLCIWHRSSRAPRGRTRTPLCYSAERSPAFPVFTNLSHGQLRVSRERLRTPLYYSAERFPGLPLCTVLGHGQSRASRERLRTPLDYSAERFPSLPSSPSWVMVSRGRHASGSEHLWTTHPGGFCASPSSPSWAWSVASVTRAASSTSGLLDRAVSEPPSHGPSPASRERSRAPLDYSTERLHRALRATRERLRPTLYYASERFRPPRARRVTGVPLS